ISQGILRVVGNGLLRSYRAEERVEERLALIERSSLAVVTLDRHGVVTSWNTGATEQYGFSADEAVGRQVLELTHTEEDRAYVESLLSQHERRDEWISRLTIRPADDPPYEALVSASAIRAEDGELNGFLLVTAPMA